MERRADSRREERLTLVAGPVGALKCTLKNSLARATSTTIDPGAVAVAKIAHDRNDR